ncbi:hypothetical protein [Aliiruegeria lutimaris]|nr:hypothetical protein [Aliiruegeria lutimaris]
MRQKPAPVRGIEAPPPRPTFRSALWLACVLSLPAYLLLSLLDYLVRWAF